MTGRVFRGRTADDGAAGEGLTRAEVLRFVEGPGQGLGRRELIEALAPERGQRTAVKEILRDLLREGVIGRRGTRGGGGRRGGDSRPNPAAADVPAVTVLDVVGIDDEGDLRLGHPERPDLAAVLPADGLEGTAPGVGDRVLARLRPGDPGEPLLARVIRVLPRRPSTVVGVVEAGGDGWRLRPADRRVKEEFVLAPDDLGGADRGDLVLAEVIASRRLGPARARVKERLGRPDDPASLTLTAAVGAGLPMSFPAEALAQAEAALPAGLGAREDLRGLDLVTIDGEDARDFDDAVWAAADADPANPGGHKVVVAIADVAHYVRPGDALDEESRKRGNSVYFPDRVIPMLPEALSNNLCSLRPDEDRACLACEMAVDADGQLRRWRFTRALMRSRARLTYTRVQAAFDGNPDEQTGPLLETVIRPLYAAFACLLEARRKRGTIELELVERKVVFGEAGEPTGVEPRRRLASNMLIEELMIAANVAAASLLEGARQSCLYRIHDKPDPVRLEALAEFLERLGVPWSRTGKKPGDFTRLLNGIEEPAMRELVSTLVLRSQAQAVYNPGNIGHFGLNLKRYAHFTSPIRRYSDLVVHRAIIRHLGLGEGGLQPGVDEPQLKSLGEHLSRCERRAMEAERRAFERLVAYLMASRVGAEFEGRVTGVAQFGLFVALDDTGAEGLVPISTLGAEMFGLDERFHALVGQRTGEAFGLGDRVKVELRDADPVQGSLLFGLKGHERGRGAELALAAWRKSGGRMPPRSGAGAGRGGQGSGRPQPASQRRFRRH